jgi:hypothetical protein
LFGDENNEIVCNKIKRNIGYDREKTQNLVLYCQVVKNNDAGIYELESQYIFRSQGEFESIMPDTLKDQRLKSTSILNLHEQILIVSKQDWMTKNEKLHILKMSNFPLKKV